MTLIPNIEQFHKFWSVRLGALALLSETLSQVLPLIQPAVPANWFMYLSIVSTIGSLVARALKQKDVPPCP
jgi:hypothetical protein